MRLLRLIANAGFSALLMTFTARAAPPQTGGERVFPAQGVVVEVKPEQQTVVIRHGAITNFMDAMTMPFKVKNQSELAGLRRGDAINFQLHVGQTESWVGQFSKTGTVTLPAAAVHSPAPPYTRHELLHFKFTNELGQAVSLSDFPGQALAITFFYTRCPLPDYCPRLSKNFEEASEKLAAIPGGPTNWHFLSCSFDPKCDSPAMLLAYGKSYHYDPAHWSFLTGPPDQMAELAQGCGVTVTADGATLNHNFRTLIIDAAGRLQTVFVTSGDLSDQIVSEIVKAARVATPSVVRSQIR